MSEIKKPYAKLPQGLLSIAIGSIGEVTFTSQGKIRIKKLPVKKSKS